MIGRGLFVLTLLSNCVLSLPVTSSHLENEDVKVMKCIVEALVDVLSRPHPLPVSQECLVILRTDDRLVSILRHQNFLKELEDIAVQGANEKAQLQGDITVSDHVTQSPETTSNVADRSMLEALGGPGERSILAQKRRTGATDGEEEEDKSPRDEESREHNEIDGKDPEKRGENGGPENLLSDSVDDWSEGKGEKREEQKDGEEEEEEEEKKRASTEENSEEAFEEDNVTKEKKGDESHENRDAPENNSEEKKSAENEETGAGERGGREPNSPQEVPHHSKEVTGEEEDKKSPEEKELQTIARRAPEDRRGLEEEGSAGRKSEEPEIESLAAIESELESVAKKLHELRRG
ncbi:chromogranin-A [Polymixia lowei]